MLVAQKAGCQVAGWLGDRLVGVGWVRASGWVAVSTEKAEKAGGAALVIVFGCIARARTKTEAAVVGKLAASARPRS